jgi:hypothetical protein
MQLILAPLRRVESHTFMLIIARVFATILGVWLIYNAIIGGEYRGALPGSSLKGESIPSWIGRIGFVVAGLAVLFFAWLRS